MSDKLKKLTKAVFETDTGQDLLEMWYDEHIVTPLFHKDTNVMYARIGMQEFVQRILTDLESE